MNIIKTFEVFNKEAVKLLKERVINIFLIDTGENSNKGITVNINKKNETQVTVLNNQRVYNLLSSAMYKQKQKSGQK